MILLNLQLKDLFDNIEEFNFLIETLSLVSKCAFTEKFYFKEIHEFRLKYKGVYDISYRIKLQHDKSLPYSRGKIPFSKSFYLINLKSHIASINSLHDLQEFPPLPIFITH